MSIVSANTFVAVPFPADLYQEVAAHYPERVSSLIEDVVRDFLDRTAKASPSRRDKRSNGVYWDRVFLPEGTRLRTKYFNEYRYAEIKGDQMLYNGKVAPSVSRLARRMRNNTSVNAWLHIEVLRPGDDKWLKADLLRK